MPLFLRHAAIRRSGSPFRIGIFAPGLLIVNGVRVVVIALCVLAGASAAGADAGPAVRAHVDRTVLAPGETLELRVSIENGQGQVDVAPLSDFRVSPRGTSTSVQVVNSELFREETHTYLLIPRREGRLTIPAMDVSVDGRTLRTEPITIRVTPRGETPTGDRDPEVWVESTLSHARAYVGQQITYTFSLYQSVRVTNATFQAPAFGGFSAEEIEKRASERKTINGRDYVVTHIHYVLSPLEAGDLEIEPAVLQLGVVRRGTQRRRSPFDDFFDDPFFNRSRVEPKVLQGPPLKLTVRPLPPYTGRDAFSGLVGRFEMTAAIPETRLQVGDATTLTVTLNGLGNLQDAPAPPLDLPDTLKSYADAPEEEIRLTPDGHMGKKTYRTALVPLASGDIRIGPVRLTYFDIDQGRYRTLTAALPALAVQPADSDRAEPLTISAEPQIPRQRKVDFKGRDILPPKESLDAVVSERPIAWPLFLSALVLPALGFGALSLVQALRLRGTGPRARMRNKALRSLKTAQAAGDACEPFLSALYQALSAAIFARAGRNGEAMTWKEAETMLYDNGLDRDTARAAAGLLADIETQKFSGARPSAQARADLLHRTRRMVRRLTR